MKRLIHTVWFGVLFACLLGLATSVQANYAYITNQDSDDVSVIDIATNTVTDTIPVGDNPMGIAVHPLGTFSTFVYVSNYLDDTVSVIDTATNTVADTVSVGSHPFGIAVHPLGTFVYVANRYSDTVSVIDTATNTVKKTVSVGDMPTCVAVHPLGTFVYVANQYVGTISVIDTATNTVADTVSVGNSPLGIAVHPLGTFVYVANNPDNTISIIDTVTNTVTSTVPVENHPSYVAVHPLGTFIYVTGAFSDVVWVIDTATNTVTDTIPVGHNPMGIAVHPLGTFVYVANQASNNVSVIDTATNAITNTVSVGTGPVSVGQFITLSEFPNDTMPPTGAVHAHDNAISPTGENVIITLDGYVKDELSISRDGGGIGVSCAHLIVDGNEIILQDESINLLGTDGGFTVTTEVTATEGAVYNVELHATDNEPEALGGPNSGLVDSTYIKVSTAPFEPTTVSVDSITYATEGGRNQNKNLLITVALKDNLGNSVANASVSIDLKRYEKIAVSKTGITRADGTVTFTYNNAAPGTYSTVVTAVNATELTWDGVTPENSFNK